MLTTNIIADCWFSWWRPSQLQVTSRTRRKVWWSYSRTERGPACNRSFIIDTVNNNHGSYCVRNIQWRSWEWRLHVCSTTTLEMLNTVTTTYAALKDFVNGSSILAPIAGTVDEPVEFFLARYKDKSLTFPDRQLSHLAMRSLCAPISSASAERIGSR